MVSGVGTGLDIQGIVDSVMVAQKRTLNQYTNKKNILDYQQKAYTQLKEGLTGFENTLKRLSDTLKKNNYKISSSNEAVSSAIASEGSTAPGVYAIDVKKCATAHQIASAGFASKTSALAVTGDLTITTAGTVFSISIEDTLTLEQLRDNINQSNNNPGVTASILKVSDKHGVDEYRLVLTANETGTEHALTLGGSALPGLDFSEELSAAQDAEFSVNGFSTVRGTNLISDVLDGVTFHLNGETGLATITIESDVDSEEQAISGVLKEMVDAYNGIIGTLAKNQTLKNLRDSTYSMIKQELQHTMEQQFGAGAIKSLLDLGIKLDGPQKKINEDGVEYVVGGLLTIDNSTLSKALKDHNHDVMNLFTDKTDGAIKTITDVLHEVETKSIFNREQMMSQQTRYLDNKINDEEARLTGVRERLVTKYAALDTFLERYNQMSSFLEQQLEALSYHRK